MDTARTCVVSGTSRGERLSETDSLPDKFYSPVFGPALLQPVVGDGLSLSETLRGEAAGCNSPLGQRSHYGLRTILGKPHVGFRCAGIVGVPGDDYGQSRRSLQYGGCLVQCPGGVRLDGRFVRVE